jgi:2-hydroxychromene-2-carboxylate isomerase
VSQTQVQYFFAFASPFAALADTRIDDLVSGAGAELVPVPVVPPPMPPPEGLAAQIQEFKASYNREDAARWAQRLGLPWNPPEQRTVDSTDAAAGWYFARDKGAERGYRNAVFEARWRAGRDIGDAEVLADCAEKAGLPRGEFVEALRKKQYHDEVPKALALCIQERVFGVPLFVVNGKRFWGNDRLEFLMEELQRG